MPDNFDDLGTNTLRIDPEGGLWYRIANPGTGFFASKTSGWTADRFTAASGGFEVSFASLVASGVLPAGVKAVRAVVTAGGGALGDVYARAAGDSNISNTPVASQEYACFVGSTVTTAYAIRQQTVLRLSADYKVEFAVSNTALAVYIAYPLEYLL